MEGNYQDALGSAPSRSFNSVGVIYEFTVGHRVNRKCYLYYVKEVTMDMFQVVL